MLDNDCDGLVDEGSDSFDDDGDGLSELEGDCDDANGWVSPQVAEDCDDGLDNNCNGEVDGTSAADDCGGTSGPVDTGGCDCDDSSASLAGERSAAGLGLLLLLGALRRRRA